MEMTPDSTKEYIWCTKLDGDSKSHQWEGRDDGNGEQIVLKRACLGVGAKESERNIIQVTSFNHKQQKVEVCICSLKSGLKEDESLADLTILPPAIFTLVAGNGPVHIVGNHMFLEDFNDMESDDEMSDDELGEEAEVDDEESEEELEEEKDEDEEIEKEPVKTPKQNKKSQSVAKPIPIKKMDEEESDDEENDQDEIEESDDEEPIEKPQTKKRKISEIKQNDCDNDIVQKKKKKKENNQTPKKSEVVKTPKKENSDTPKTPLQQKENKTPTGVKRTPKEFTSLADLRNAVKKYPGGKPKKEEKFKNWLNHTFKVTNDEWIKKLWKAHKEDLGL